MAETSVWGLELPAAIILGAIAAAAYLIGYTRHRGAQFTLLDALVVVAIMAIVTAVAMPLLNAASDRASSSALAATRALSVPSTSSAAPKKRSAGHSPPSD